MYLNGLQRIGVILSVGWAVFILGVAANQYSEAESFDAELYGACPTLAQRAFVHWRDVKSGKEIAIYREGEKSLNCQEAGDRAKLLIAERGRGVIEPAKTFTYLRLLLAVFVPVFILWTFSYVLAWLFKWVLDGFRKGGKRA